MDKVRASVQTVCRMDSVDRWWEKLIFNTWYLLGHSHRGGGFLRFVHVLRSPSCSCSDSDFRFSIWFRTCLHHDYSFLYGCSAPWEGPTTFACKIQECLWQDWYIFTLFLVHDVSRKSEMCKYRIALLHFALSVVWQWVAIWNKRGTIQFLTYSRALPCGHPTFVVTPPQPHMGTCAWSGRISNSNWWCHNLCFSNSRYQLCIIYMAFHFCANGMRLFPFLARIPISFVIGNYPDWMDFV